MSHEVERGFLFCSDHRVLLWKNIKKKLFLPGERVTALSWFGGPIALANVRTLPSDFVFAVRQINFLFQNFPTVKEMVLVGHKCGYYANVSSETVTIERMKEDLEKAAAFVAQEWGVKVVSYYAHDTTGHGYEFEFEKICALETANS